MAGLDSSLDVGVGLRRLGVKGTTNVLPIVPGVFPTMPVSELHALAARPKAAHAIGGFGAWRPAAQTSEWRFGGTSDMLVRWLLFHTTQTNLLWYARLSKNYAVGPAAANAEFGAVDSLCGWEYMSPRITTTGVVMGMGSQGLVSDLDWLIPAGSALSVHHAAVGLYGAHVTLTCDWIDLPAGSVEA